MDISNILSSIAIVVSIISLGASTWIAVRQTKLSRRASHAPVLMSVISEFRSAQFHEYQDYICSSLASEHKPSLGVSGLPEKARTAVYSVAYYYEQVAALVKLEILDEGEVLYLLHNRIETVWEAIAPYVFHERSTSKHKHLLSLLERLHKDAAKFSINSYKGGRSWCVPQAPSEGNLISPELGEATTGIN